MIVTVAFPLLATLLLELVRRRLRAAPDDGAVPAWTWYGARVAILLCAPLWFIGTPFLGGPALLVGDSAGHALVADAIASGRAPHAWVDAIGSGFPLGHHYPPLGFYVLASLLEVGLSPARAVAVIAMFVWLAKPLIVIEASRAHRLHPVAALGGAFFMMAVEPYSSFIGGWRTIAVMGMVSQALGEVGAAVWLVSALHERGRRTAGLAAVALVAAHPQIFTAVLAALVIAALAAWDRRLLGRVVVSAGPAMILGAALYVPGVVTLGAPFGWPRGLGWLHDGPAPYKLADYLDGWIVDFWRPPCLTALWSFALCMSVFRLASGWARAALATSVGLALLSVSGGWMAGLGAVGRAVMSVFQPLRVLAVLPYVGVACVAVALHVCIVTGAAALSRRRGRLVAPLVVLAVLAALVGPEVAARSAETRRVLAKARPIAELATCKIGGEPVVVDDDLRSRLGALRGGRFVLALPPEDQACLRALGVELAVAVPKATTAAVGAHVGVAWTAFEALGGDHRFDVAEALGVRWVLARASLAPSPPFRLAWTRGPLALFEREGGTDLVGAACIVDEWRGSEADLAAAVQDDLLADPRRLLGDPARLTALDGARAPLAKSKPSDDRCDARAARVTELPRPPGELEATIDASAPVDVVLRASALPAWRVEVDGAPVPYRRVAPGFMSVRVSEGRHRVTAVVKLERYGWVVRFALVVALSLIFVPARIALRVLRRARELTRPRRAAGAGEQGAGER